MQLFNSSLPLSHAIVKLESEEGKKLFLTSSFQENHKLLFNFFEQQIWFSYCGVASATMILNALKSDTTHVQLGINDNQKKQVIFPLRALCGMTLRELKNLFDNYNLSTQIFYADRVDLNTFRKLAIQALEQSNSFVVVNYSRRTLGQMGWGHFSPLSAYNSVADKFLVIDVAKDPEKSSVWIDTKILYSAMYTKDVWAKKFRGFIVAKKPSQFS